VFKNNKKQYINILQQDKELKLDYKIFNKKNVEKQENSSFLIYDVSSMPQDALVKLLLLQKNITYTYLTAIVDSTNQDIKKSNEKNIVQYKSGFLDDDYIVEIPKNEIAIVKEFYKNSGLDYILSPFHILYRYMQNNQIQNSLNMFIHNNYIYSIILDKAKNILSTDISKLTSILDISSEDSYDIEEVSVERVYNEVYYLEIQEYLNNIITNFLEKHTNEELKTIEFLHNINILSSEQIAQLQDETMLQINYQFIDTNEYIELFSTQKDASKYSFIEPRIKKDSNQTKYILALLVLLSFIAIGSIISLQSETKQEKKVKQKIAKKLETKIVQKKIDKISQRVEKKIIKPILIKKPDHILLNTQVAQEVTMLLDTVPYDALLKKVEIRKDNSIFIVDFIVNTTSLSDMQIKLNNIYSKSKILLSHKNNSIQNVIIENTNIKTTNLENINLKPYKKEKYLSIPEIGNLLYKALPQNSTIKLKNKQKGKYITYNFIVKSNIDQPADFFIGLDKLKILNRSVNIEFPVRFNSTSKGLVVDYKLVFRQENKINPKLKK